MTIGAVVLCGGKSSRMGTSKAMLPFGDETMLQRVVRLVSSVTPQIVVVAAADQALPDLPDSVAIARDQAEAQGPLEGLRVGLSALPESCTGAFACSCDLPGLAPKAVEQMIAGLNDNLDIVVPKEGKFHHPLFAVYRCTVVPVIEALLAAERRRPVFLFDECRTKRIDVEELRAADPELNSFENMNTPEAYEAALEKYL